MVCNFVYSYCVRAFPFGVYTISTHIYSLTKGKKAPVIKASYRAFTAVVFVIIVISVTVANVVAAKKTKKTEKLGERQS